MMAIEMDSYRPTEPQTELNKVAGADTVIIIEIKGRIGTAKILAEHDEVVGSDGAIAINVAKHAKQPGRGGRVANQHIIVATDAIAIAIQAADRARNGRRENRQRVTTVGQRPGFRK